MTGSEHLAWGDLDILESWMDKHAESGDQVVEVACGENVIVPHVLGKLGRGFTYIAVDTNADCLRGQQRQRSRDLHCIQANSCKLPLRTSSADLVVFHHAIDDILETCGPSGVYDSIGEALRIARPGGHLIFSHCFIEHDPYTSEISLEDVEEMLEEFGQANYNRRRARHQDWLFLEVE